MANQVTENLFNAIDEIISSRMQGLGYDKTIKAIVIDASEAEKGFYKVAEVGSEKTNSFKAYSDNTSYVANDYVYVTTPLGDATSNNRFIIGKYVDENDEYYNYVNPMSKFLDITGNLITHLDKKEYGIIANYEPHSETRLWEDHGLNLRGFDRLSIKGDFKTLLQRLDIFSGSYGLVLVLQDSNNEFTSFSLTNKEMYGNPYYFETFYRQEVLIDISKIDEIKSMWLSLIQCNDFLKSDGSLAPVVESSNIFLRAPYVSVGYDISNFEGDDLRISTEDELDWNGTEDPVTKTINAKWIHVPEGASAIVVDEKAEIPRNPTYKEDNTDLSRYPQPELKVDIRWFQHVDSYTTMVANKINDIESDIVIIKERINALENPPEKEKTSDLIDTSDLEIEDAVQYPEMSLEEMKEQLEKYEAELKEQEALYLSKNPPVVEEDDLIKRRYTGYKHKDRNWVEIESTLDQNFYPKNDFSYTFTTPLADTTTPALRFKAIASVPSERYVNAQFTSTDEYKALANVSNNVATVAECLDLFYEVMDGTTTLTAARKAINKLYKEKGDMSQEDYQTITSALTAYATARSEIKHIESQELTFPNLGYYPDKYKDDIANLHIIVDPDGLKGQYLIYDDSGIITDETQASEERYCEAVYTTLAGVLNSEYSQLQDFAYEVDESELICWYIPLENTMIATPVESIEYFPGKGDVVITDYVISDANNDEGLPLGHYCKIQRTPQREQTKINDTELIAEHHMYSRQVFRIKDYYTQMETNNFIYCRVTKKSTNQIAKANMAFGISGTNGTNSTFIIRTYEINEDGSISNVPTTALSLRTTRQVEDLNGDIVKRISGYGEIGLVPELYDYNNQLLADYFKDPAHPVKYSFKSDLEKVPFDIRLEPNGCAIVSWAGTYDNLNSLKEDFYLVVEAEVPYKIIYNFETYTQEDLNNDLALVELGRQVGDYKLDEQGNKIPAENSRTRDDYLKVFTPISIVAQKLLRQEKKVSSGDKITTTLNPKDYQRQVLGANRVIYDRNGSNAKYYKDPYQLFDSLLEEVEDIEWSARIVASVGTTGAKKASIESFYPIVTPSGILQPLEMFILGTDSTDSILGNFCVQGKDQSGNVVCIQPVLIMQNKYGSSMLNKWDGGLTINEKNGTILAAMVGAGIKDINNTFSGVLMGDVTQAFKDNHNGLGLYGFHQSDQSFGFNVDGTAFIGKAGHGRITFNGNEGIIQSGAYSDGYSEEYKVLGGTSIRPAQGMQIDLDGSDGVSASLKAFGSAGGFVLDTKGHPDFKDKYNANYVPKHLRPTGTESGILTDEDMKSYSKYSYDEETGNYTYGAGVRLPVTFKLFTGTYNNRPNPDKELGQFYNPNLPRERGMIYFDIDGQYIQSTNYDGYYDTAKTVYPEGRDNQKNPPGWFEANTTEPSHSPATRGTFIDLKNGWIDTRSGIIGGWKITQYSLASMKDEIILSTGNPKASDIMHRTPYIQVGASKQIFISPGNNNSSNVDERVPHIRIGATQESGEMKGNFWIANYKVNAVTRSAQSIACDTITLGTGTLNLPNVDGGDVSVSEYIDKLSYTTMDLKSSSITVDTVNYWQLVDDTRTTKMGIRLDTAGGSQSVIVFKPINSDIALLGTKDNPWHYSYIKKGLYVYEEFTAFTDDEEQDYRGQPVNGWHYVATQPWITNVIVPLLQKRMKQINSLYWYRTTKIIKGLEALSGVCKTVVTDGGDQATIEALAYTITTEKTITVTGPVSTGKAIVPTITAWTQYKQDMLQWQIKINNQLNALESRIQALESFVNGHSHSGFLTSVDFSSCPYQHSPSSGSSSNT